MIVTLLEENVRVYLSGDEAGEADHPRRLPQTGKGGCRSQVECARVRSVMRLDRSHEELDAMTSDLDAARAVLAPRAA